MEYMKISIPRNLVKRIERIAEHYGYRSISEFVIEAVRIRLEKLEGVVDGGV